MEILGEIKKWKLIDTDSGDIYITGFINDNYFRDRVLNYYTCYEHNAHYILIRVSDGLIKVLEEDKLNE